MLDQVLQRLSRRDVGLLVLQVDTVVRLRLLTLVPAHREATPPLRPARFRGRELKKEKKKSRCFSPEEAEDEDEAEDDAAHCE